LKAEAIAELDAEDADDCYISRPDTPPGDFVSKTPMMCAAHVVGIGNRKLEDWTVRPAQLSSNPLSYNSREVFNKQLKLMHEKEKRDKLKDEIVSIQVDRRNALDVLTYERAKFRADCAARHIRTPEDAERAFVRIAAARAEVVSRDTALLVCDFN
jgi:hypothetical protein